VGLSPLARARQAAEDVPFAGLVSLRWTDQQGGVHSTEVRVQAGSGVLQMDGPSRLAAAAGQRWLFRHGGWDLMSPAGAAAPDADVAPKYAFTTAAGPLVAGRPTTLVVARVEPGPASPAHVELLYLDDATGLLLRRDQLDGSGRVARAIGFEQLQIGPPSRAPQAPSHSADRRPRAAASTGGLVRAPAELAGQYRRVGVLHRPGAIQILYSDGLHAFSLFAQPGRIDHHKLPAGGAPVLVGSAHGLHYTWAGGHVVLWQAGAAAYTVVGDGDPEEVLAAARSVPRPPAPGTWERVRRSCGALLEALGAR